VCDVDNEERDAWVTDLQQGYDRVAAAYTERVFGELAHKPFDRELLDRFAERVRPLGSACDLGCGPGHVARYLHERGLPVVGVDLSPVMVKEARQLNPGIAFHQGSMLALDFPDAAFGGIAAFYSIIHVPRHLLPRAFTEMHRTLRPGGLLLLAFHIGQEDIHLDEWMEQKVNIDFYFFDRAGIESCLTETGFAVEQSIERPPYTDVEAQTRRAYILARRPA
jgi:SAM-dependent methyltransferase